MAIGKVGRNGTLNENGAFYSVQDVNVLLENSGGDVDLPKPTVEDAGKAVVVDEEGKYALGEGGGGDSDLYFIIRTTAWDEETYEPTAIDKTMSEISGAFKSNKIVVLIDDSLNEHKNYHVYHMVDYTEQYYDSQLVATIARFEYSSCPSASSSFIITTISVTYANNTLTVVPYTKTIQ